MFPIILLYLLRLCQAQQGMVKYVVNLDSQAECCDEASEEYMDLSGVTVTRYNESIACMFGNIKFLKEVAVENTMIEVVLYKEAAGKQEVMFTHEICDVCGEVKKGPDSDYYGYIKYFGIPDECPFEVGEYAVKNLVVDSDDFPVNSNTAGRYQAYLTLFKINENDCKSNKEFLFCVTLKFIIELV